MGNTGYQPVPMGNLPSGTSEASFPANGNGSPQRLQSGPEGTETAKYAKHAKSAVLVHFFAYFAVTFSMPCCAIPFLLWFNFPDHSFRDNDHHKVRLMDR